MREGFQIRAMAAPASAAFVLAVAWTAVYPATKASAAVLDRIAASVGTRVITESEVILDLRVAEFLDQKPIVLSGKEKRAAANRLVDQYLILHDAEANHVALPSEADAARLLAATKAQYPSDADYRAALARYQITEADVSNHLLAGLRALRYSDFRFRPEVQLSDEDMRAYYGQLMAARPANSPAPAPTFEESRGRVQNLMTDERVLQAMDRWLGVVREESNVRFWDEAFR